MSFRRGCGHRHGRGTKRAARGNGDAPRRRLRRRDALKRFRKLFVFRSREHRVVLNSEETDTLRDDAPIKRQRESLRLVTKPLLERKRRARINRCLDELKDLMVDALETEGEDISKLEKADILELTVRHLQRLQAARTSGQPVKSEEVSGENRWLSGFGHCAAEACRFLSGLPGEAADRLARHLATGLQTTRQTNSPINLQAKPNLVSPTLASLELTANLVSPNPLKPSDDNNEITKTTVLLSQRMTPYPEVNPERSSPKTDGISPLPTKLSRLEADQKLQLHETVITEFPKDKGSVEKRKSNDSNNNDDDEEIDVEGVDEADPMWRPW